MIQVAHWPRKAAGLSFVSAKRSRPGTTGAHSMDTVTMSFLSEHFLINRRAKNETKEFPPLPSDFGKSLNPMAARHRLVPSVKWCSFTMLEALDSNQLAVKLRSALNVTESCPIIHKVVWKGCPLSKHILLALSQQDMWIKSNRFVKRSIWRVRLVTCQN